MHCNKIIVNGHWQRLTSLASFYFTCNDNLILTSFLKTHTGYFGQLAEGRCTCLMTILSSQELLMLHELRLLCIICMDIWPWQTLAIENHARWNIYCYTYTSHSQSAITHFCWVAVHSPTEHEGRNLLTNLHNSESEFISGCVTCVHIVIELLWHCNQPIDTKYISLTWFAESLIICL